MKSAQQKRQFYLCIAGAFLLLGMGPCSPLLMQNVIEQKKHSHRDDIHCPIRFPNAGYCAKIEALDEPFVIGRSHSFRLYFWEENHGSTSEVSYSDPPGSRDIWLWMEMPVDSHGSFDVNVNPTRDQSGQVVAGVYDLTRVVFTMASRNAREWWEIHIRLRNETGQELDEAVERIGP